MHFILTGTPGKTCYVTNILQLAIYQFNKLFTVVSSNYAQQLFKFSLKNHFKILIITQLNKTRFNVCK